MIDLVIRRAFTSPIIRMIGDISAGSILVALVNLAGGVGPAAGAETSNRPATELTISLQQGVAGYGGCQTIDPYKTVVSPSKADIKGLTLKFTKLFLPGENPQVLKARLR